MTDERTLYATIAEAEKAITDAGYVRDPQRHVWVNGDMVARVVRTTAPENNFKFFVQWG